MSTQDTKYIVVKTEIMQRSFSIISFPTVYRGHSAVNSHGGLGKKQINTTVIKKILSSITDVIL